MKKIILLIILVGAISTTSLLAQNESGATKMLMSGHAAITAVIDSTQANFNDASFSAIFLYQLSDKLFLESELEFVTDGGSVETGLEHANLVWLIGKNIAFHAGRFVPHFGAYRGKLGEGFMNRFATDPVGFGDGGIGTMEAVGFGFQGGFAAGVSKFNYDFWVSNGPELLTDNEGAGQFEYEAYYDNNKNKAIGGRIGFLPLSNSSLELGLSFENAAKTGDLNTNFENVGVTAMAVDVNYYHKITPLKSTLRITGEFKQQKVDKFNYVLDSEDTITFDNSSSSFYGMVSLRPAYVSSKVLRNFEIALRYSQFKTPDGAPWSYYDENGKSATLNQTSIALDYWLKWNCLAKLCYQMQDGAPDQILVQMYYGF